VSSAEAIQTTGLARHFGAVRALSRVDLRVAEGESVVVFGPNGAGKTTLIRILTLSLKASGGTFRIAGLDPRKADLQIRQRIGVISHQSYLYDDLTARQNLEFFSRLYGVPDPAQRADELLHTVNLTHRADDSIGTFSRGMQQRVSLARSLVHDPQIVFLDEPFTGLDPIASRMLRDTLERLRHERRTVFLVTHNLAQGLELSDRWAILARGRIVEDGRSDETDRLEFEQRYFDRFAATAAAARS